MEERNLRKTRVGVVVSDKMDKTIVVAVKDSVQHPLYKKILKRTAKFKARDEQNECGIGDRVEIMQAQWRKRGVSFRDSERIRLITVFFHDKPSEEGSLLFVGHVGVLLCAEIGRAHV